MTNELPSQKPNFDFMQITPDIIRPEKFPLPDDYIAQMKKQGLHELADTYRKAMELASEFARAGGRALLIGGCVRDHFFGKISKDFDMEVYGLQPEIIEKIAQKANA